MVTKTKTCQQKLQQLRVDTTKGVFGDVTDKDFLKVIKYHHLRTIDEELQQLQKDYWSMLRTKYEPIDSKSKYYKYILKCVHTNRKEYRRLYKSNLLFYPMRSGRKSSRENTIHPKRVLNIKKDLGKVGKARACKRLALITYDYFLNSKYSRKQVINYTEKLENKLI